MGSKAWAHHQIRAHRQARGQKETARVSGLRALAPTQKQGSQQQRRPGHSTPASSEPHVEQGMPVGVMAVRLYHRQKRAHPSWGQPLADYSEQNHRAQKTPGQRLPNTPVRQRPQDKPDNQSGRELRLERGPSQKNAARERAGLWTQNRSPAQSTPPPPDSDSEATTPA